MNNAVFGRTMENVRKYRDIKLVRTDKKRNKLVSEPNYYTMKLIDDNLAIIEMRKVKVKMNKPIYLGLSILELNEITMYEFWYDYVKVKYEDNFNCDRPLPIGVNKKVVCLIKDELGGAIITEFIALRPKTYSYRTDDLVELKKAKGTKKCVFKKMVGFNDYKKCLFEKEKILKSQQRFKSENHSVYAECINKIALSYDDDKRIATSDGITSYPYGYILKNLNYLSYFLNIELSYCVNIEINNINNN